MYNGQNFGGISNIAILVQLYFSWNKNSATHVFLDILQLRPEFVGDVHLQFWSSGIFITVIDIFLSLITFPYEISRFNDVWAE